MNRRDGETTEPMGRMLERASGRVRLHMPGHKGKMPAEWLKPCLLYTSSGIITHRFDVRDYEKGFAAMISGQSGKVILDWAHIND